jgi:hypothetical protein
MSGQGICCDIRIPRFVDHSVLQANQFGIHLHLPWGMEALVHNVSQTAVISKDDKFGMLKIRTPLLNSYNNCQEFLFIGGQAAGARA